MKRNEIPAKYKWDFSKLYKNYEEWKKDLTKIIDKFKEIVKLKGKLNQKENFKKYLLFNEEIELIASKLKQFLHMGDINTTDLSYQELNGLFSNKIIELSSKISFVEPELKQIGKKNIIEWIKNDQDIQQYEYNYCKFFRNAKYVLSERDEEIISNVSQSRGVAYDLYNLLSYADKKTVFIDYKGKKEKLTNELYSEIMEKTDPLKEQWFRKEVSQIFVQHLIDKKHSFSRVYEGIIQCGVESVKLRGYKNTLHAALINDDVSEEIYKSLINYGKKTSNLFKRYHLLLKKYFGLNKYYSTDSNLKLVTNLESVNKKYTVEEAKDIIRKSLFPLGKEYLDKLEIAWSDYKIDYFEDTNKKSGAYSSGGGGNDPIILMNWDYTISSVNTLTHEIGHSVHTILADENNKYPLSNYPIILAEVASTVNEHLLFDYLYKNSTNNDEKISLLQNRIDEIIGTFYRQIQYADFEWSVHKMVEKSEPLNADKLANLFVQKSNEFGWDIFDIIEDDSKKYGWPRILHFFNSPYYVYKYATCIVASFKLYNDVIDNHSKILLNFLKQGGRKEPLLILKDIGIDYTETNVYEGLISKLTQFIDELEILLNKKNKLKFN